MAGFVLLWTSSYLSKASTALCFLGISRARASACLICLYSSRSAFSIFPKSVKIKLIPGISLIVRSMPCNLVYASDESFLLGSVRVAVSVPLWCYLFPRHKIQDLHPLNATPQGFSWVRVAARIRAMSSAVSIFGPCSANAGCERTSANREARSRFFIYSVEMNCTIYIICRKFCQYLPVYPQIFLTLTFLRFIFKLIVKRNFFRKFSFVRAAAEERTKGNFCL